MVFTLRNSPLLLTGSARIVIMSNSNLKALQHGIRPGQNRKNAIAPNYYAHYTA